MYQLGTRDDYVRRIIAVGRRMGITPRGCVIAIATGLVESNIKVYANGKVPESMSLPHDAVGSDGKSVGIFQQQVVMGNGWWWGSAEECMSPERSSELFFERLARRDYNNGDAGAHAQAVQGSAFPDRYGQRMSEAQQLYDRLSGSAPTAPPAPVGEKVLPYDKAVVPQETGFWCGPASTQVVLNSRGIIRSEADLAREIGTHTGGTDYVGLIERELDRIVPDANYTSVYIENDPPSQAQKDRLWRDVVQSINAGWGLVMNWVAPPSNYPRGVKRSPNPSYGGGTVFHYVSCMGYDDTGERALWIADSGFRPFGYWISFDQAASLIPPKGYCYANTGAPNQSRDPLEELLMLEVHSWSIYAKPGEDKMPVYKLIQALDAHGPHEPYWEQRARTGDPAAIQDLARVAANGPWNFDLNRYVDDPAAKHQALSVLLEIQAAHPEWITAATPGKA